MPSKRPTHVADTDKVGCGHSIGGADLDPEERGLTPKPHRSNAQIIGGLENVLFEMVQSWLGIPVVEEAEKLSFAQFVPRGAIAADANAEDSGTTTLALGLNDGVEDHSAASGQVAVGVEGPVRK